MKRSDTSANMSEASMPTSATRAAAGPLRVFIHTNERQWLGALVAAHALKRNSRHADAFAVEFIHVRDHPFLAAREGQPFLRGGTTRIWRMGDLQSFTPLRFLAPKLAGYQGRAVVIDPDVFAVGDVHELLTRDMQGAAVMGRHRSAQDAKQAQLATSVMLLDCARLQHWDCEREFGELFEFKRDYKDWMVLAHEPPEHIGWLEPEWNDFDHLTPQTRMLHNTKRRTQPWKTGLPVDFTPADKLKDKPCWPDSTACAPACSANTRYSAAMPAIPIPRRSGCSSACSPNAWPTAASARRWCGGNGAQSHPPRCLGAGRKIRRGGLRCVIWI